MKRILCYGDSNTWGYNPVDKTRYDENTRWTRLIGKELGNDYEIIECGHNGRTFCFTEPAMPHRNGCDHLRTILESNNPIDLVIVMLGTNDLKEVYNASAKMIGRGLRRTLREINTPYYYEPYNIPKVLVITPIRIGDNYRTASDTYEEFKERAFEESNRLAPFFKEQADAFGCYYLDAGEYARASEIDCMHLSPKGHKALADAISKKIKDIFE